MSSTRTQETVGGRIADSGSTDEVTNAPVGNSDPVVPLSTNRHLLNWVEKMAQLTKPDAIHWVDGSQEENEALCAQMVAGGTFIKLDEELWPQAMSPASKTAPSSARSLRTERVPPITGKNLSRCAGN